VGVALEQGAPPDARAPRPFFLIRIWNVAAASKTKPACWRVLCFAALGLSGASDAGPSEAGRA